MSGPPVKSKYRRRDAAVALLAGLGRGRVLDAPCGEGLTARALAAAGHEVWAADLDPGVLAGRDGLRFQVVDLERPLPYPDRFFDAVVSLEGIEHLEAPAGCLAEFARVLRPGGRLVVSTPNVNGLQSRIHYFLAGRFSGFRPVTRRPLAGAPDTGHWHVTVPYLPTLALLLDRRGFRVDHVGVTMVKRSQWLLAPLALPMWIKARGAPGGSVARLLGSWPLLLGRNVVLRAIRRG